MATLQKQKGKYWVLVESVRVNGKPRPRILAYLGKTEDILEKISGQRPVSSKSYEYGTVAVYDHFIKKTQVVNLFDSLFQNRKIPTRNSLTVGQTMAAIIMQRALRPGSKSSFQKWAKKTFLPQLYNVDITKIDSQHFWDLMDEVSVDDIQTLESKFTSAIVKQFSIPLDLLLYDYTNFFTFIDSDNDRNTIAQRGHNKQKRDDLRQFSLALLVTRSSQIPLFTDVYQGNISDAKEFDKTVSKIKTRLLELSNDIKDITIVFDKGSNSIDNFKSLGKLNYVASFVVTHDKELREIPYKKFYDLILNEGQEDASIIRCYRLKKTIWGEERTVVMYKSQALYDGQLNGLLNDLKLIEPKLKDLQLSAQRGFFLKKSKRVLWTEELLKKEAESYLNKQFVRDVLTYKISQHDNNSFKLEFGRNNKALKNLKETILGKRVLVTGRHNWSDKEIIDAYLGQSQVEDCFRKLKNPFHNSVRPQYHWTDQKIIVHTFCCLLSLTITNLIVKKAHEAGFVMSADEIIDRLADIRKVKYLYPKNKSGKTFDIKFDLEAIEDKQTLALFNSLMAV